MPSVAACFYCIEARQCVEDEGKGCPSPEREAPKPRRVADRWGRKGDGEDILRSTVDDVFRSFEEGKMAHCPESTDQGDRNESE